MDDSRIVNQTAGKETDENTPLIQSGGMYKRQKKKTRLFNMFIATFVAALGSLSFGSCLGYSSSALQDLQSTSQGSELHLSTSQGKWFSSLVNVGAIFGGLLTGEVLIDAFGRKGTLMGIPIPFVLGWLLIAFASDESMLLIGRFITGIGLGAVSLTVPIYIAETSTPRLRGGLGSVNQLAITLGFLFSFTCGVYLKWNLLAIVSAIPATLLAIFMFFMPETPRWLLAHKQRQEALKSLEWLRGPQADNEEEMTEIEANLALSSSKISWKEFLTPSLAKPLFIGIGLMLFQQLSCINGVLFNCASIFEAAGFTNAKKVTIIIGAVQFVGTGVACLVVDRVGRRVLLLIASVVMCLSLVALGVYFEIYIPKKSSSQVDVGRDVFLTSISHSVSADKISWLSIMSLILFIIGFSIAWGPLPWLMMSEIFPTRARGRAGAISTFVNWFGAFIVTLTFEPLVHSITFQGTYWMYGGFMFLSFVFVFFAVPETKGKTLEEIEALFQSGSSAPYKSIDTDAEK